MNNILSKLGLFTTAPAIVLLGILTAVFAIATSVANAAPPQKHFDTSVSGHPGASAKSDTATHVNNKNIVGWVQNNSKEIVKVFDKSGNVIGLIVDKSLQDKKSPALHGFTEAAKTPVKPAGKQYTRDKLAALVKGASGGSMQLRDVFNAQGGMVGLVIESPSGAKKIAYASPDATLLFPRGAYNKSGENVFREDLREQNVYIQPEQIAALIKGNTFTIGDSGPVVTAFIDPNCIWCNRFYKQILPHVKDGDLRVRVAMVGVIRPSSKGKSVTILAADDPAKMLHKDEMNFNKKQEEGGIKVLDVLPPEAVAKVEENVAAMAKAGPVATPALLYCKKGSGLVYVRGMPPMDEFVANVVSSGHPSCR